MIAAPSKPTIRHWLTRQLRAGAVVLVDQLSVLGTQPQGSAWNDTFDFADNCTAAFPFHFIVLVPSNVLKMNAAKLSFFLQAFRSYNDFSVNGTQAAGGHAHNHSATHQHNGLSNPLNTTGPASAGTAHNHTYDDVGATFTVDLQPPGSTDSVGAHSHGISSSATIGIFESTVATGVTVKINGVDRTAALGGGAGFATDQIELDVTQWLNIGAKNTIDLTPSGNGRILGHLRLTGFIQAA
jgi:hypothetical protein